MHSSLSDTIKSGKQRELHAEVSHGKTTNCSAPPLSHDCGVIKGKRIEGMLSI